MKPLHALAAALGCLGAATSRPVAIRHLDRETYLRERQELVDVNLAYRNDRIELNDKEIIVSDWLHELTEYERNRTDGEFPPGQNFFDVKHVIDESPLIPLLDGMPKGAVLHGHLSAMVDRRWLIKEGTYDQNCWRSEDMRLAISESRPDDQGGWQRCVDLRAEADTAEEFDDEVYHSIVLNREETEGEGSAVWEKFELCFIRIWDLVWYRPLTERYVWQALQDLRDQNLQYAEWRVVTGNLFDLGGRKYTVEEEVEFYLDIQRRFVQEVGPIEMRIIPCASRDQDRETVGAKMRETFFLRQKYPDFVIGFDVVGEEDTGRETLYYLDQYLELKALEAEYNLSLPLFFHDGESVKTDNQNLIDAFLMGTQRVGHAYNLFRFPDLIKTAREEEVGLEICPISNQLLKLVADLRNHPAASYIASGLPITVSPDDPGVLQYEGVHYDYYMAVMSWNVDLAALKTLARNSLALSAMEPERKLEYLAVHESLWDRWIDELLAGWVAQQPTWRTENSAVVAEISR